MSGSEEWMRLCSPVGISSFDDDDPTKKMDERGMSKCEVNKIDAVIINVKSLKSHSTEPSKIL